MLNFVPGLSELALEDSSSESVPATIASSILQQQSQQLKNLLMRSQVTRNPETCHKIHEIMHKWALMKEYNGLIDKLFKLCITDYVHSYGTVHR